MKITREDVLRVAELAHLELSPEEVELYRAQLDEIVAYVGKLQEIDVSSIVPMTQTLPRDAAAREHSPRTSVEAKTDGLDHREPDLREDRVLPCTIGNDVVERAPDAAKPFFRVPRVIEK
jgi:aspartyl-tRNA(Asn)/glutamyl-tRNA(Gln) amidotransferase subunit C